MERQDELAAIDAVLSGDADAYATLVRAYKGLAAAVCASFLGNTLEAEDAAQETFIKAYSRLSSFRRESSFPTWLCAIARNLCLDALQKQNAAKTQSLDLLMELKGDFLAAPQEEEGLGHSDICALVDALPPDYRLALTLRETQGFSYAEIAEAMDCTVDAVKARLRRARKALMRRARHFIQDPESNISQGSPV